MKTMPKPCKSCPWRLETCADDIPHFDLELAEGLAKCCPNERGHGPDFNAPLFACHKSTEGSEAACAGWLATVGNRHPVVRLAVMTNRLPTSALQSGNGWPALHQGYSEVLTKLRSTHAGGGKSQGDLQEITSKRKKETSAD